MANVTNDIKAIKWGNFFYTIPKLLFKSIGTLFSYATIFAVFLHILYYLGPMKYFQFSLLFISIVIALIGGLISYYYPRMFTIPYFNIDIRYENEAYKIILGDILFHQLPLLLLILNYDKTIKKDNLLFFTFFVIFYLMICNECKIYNIDKNNKKGQVLVRIFESLSIMATIYTINYLVYRIIM